MTTSESGVPIPPIPKGSIWVRTPIAIAFVVLISPVWAGIEFDVGDVAGAGWVASAVRVAIDYQRDSAIDVTISADTVELTDGLARIEQLAIGCLRTNLSGDYWQCSDGIIGFDFHGQRVETGYRFARLKDGYRLEIPALQIHSMILRANARIEDRSWEVDVGLDTDDLSRFVDVAALFNRVGVELVEGSLKLEATLRGKGESVSGDVQFETSGLSFSDESGLRAGEGLAFAVHGAFSREQADWRFDSLLRLDDGEIIIDSFYLQAGGRPREISATGVWRDASSRLQIDRFEVDHPDVLQMRGSVDISFVDTPVLNAVTVALPSTPVEPLYRHYVQSLALGGALESVEIDGEVAVNIEWQRTQSDRVGISIHQLNLEDRLGNFAVYGLEGEVNWGGEEKRQLTHLEWSGGAVYTLDIGPGRLFGEFRGSRFWVTEPVLVPLLDGLLSIDKFEIEEFGRTPVWRMSGGLTPVSMEMLCHALDWPSFSGTLAGSIPGVVYEGGEITIDGAMVMRVFDGEVLLTDLQLTGAFSPVPELRANVDVWGMDLEQLTRAFSFGNIEGKLDGHIHDLVLQDWRPIAFDAQFATPEDDDSRHRISQNAVDSLARVGGGSGALSATFLSFLEEFPYHRLGLSCRLRNGVCAMGGVESAERGYYIVKGDWFPPRIDVLGFNDRVEWSVLIERLRNIANSQAPIIE